MGSLERPFFSCAGQSNLATIVQLVADVSLATSGAGAAAIAAGEISTVLLQTDKFLSIRKNVLVYLS